MIKINLNGLSDARLLDFCLLHFEFVLGQNTSYVVTELNDDTVLVDGSDDATVLFF